MVNHFEFAHVMVHYNNVNYYQSFFTYENNSNLFFSRLCISVRKKHNNKGYGLVCTKIRFAFGDSIAFNSLVFFSNHGLLNSFMDNISSLIISM